ncbi:hypothetical protein BC828DRAFT_346042 [Blastocladiella britannica]|nr:hypothetical protein BC828DRAFT_346042 [Blastocladiella britannica]
MPPNTKLYRPPVADESNSHQATLTSLAADYAARAANYQRGVDIAQAIVRKFDSKNGQQLTGVTAVDARVQTLVKNITTAELKADVEYLSGEATGSPLTSRHSLAKGHVDAAKWVKAKYESYGCKTVELVSFRDTYGPNVVCTIPGTDLAQEHVVLGAHLDDRGSQFTASARAPGANDDGSGSSMLLASLRHLKESGFRLRRTVKVVNFCGEEQGLIGSKAYAQAAKKRGDKIVFMLQGDMLAYRVPGEPLQCALPAAHASPDASAVVSQVARAYVPEVVVGQTSACCSDHQSFYEQGFVSTQIYERNGPIADPFYHNKGDLARRSGYDYEQLQGLARIALATIVTVAEIDDTVTPK